MQRKQLFSLVFLCVLLCSSSAFAGIWFELKEAPCWTGAKNSDGTPVIIQDDGVVGRYKGSIDCFNKDFNGGGARTILTLKAFQTWEFGSVFFYYDITDPWNSPAAKVISPNELNGFFGGTTIAVSSKKILAKILGKAPDTGFLADLSFKYEMEHVSKVGMLHYYGLQWDLAFPFLDYLTAVTEIRHDPSLEGIDLQVGLAWGLSFPIASQDFLFTGFLAWGVFGQGAGRGTLAGTGAHGAPYLYTKPQILWDFGKLIQFTPKKVYLGFEYQISVNRYLVVGKTEDTLQAMARWNI